MLQKLTPAELDLDFQLERVWQKFSPAHVHLCQLISQQNLETSLSQLVANYIKVELNTAQATKLPKLTLDLELEAQAIEQALMQLTKQSDTQALQTLQAQLVAQWFIYDAFLDKFTALLNKQTKVLAIRQSNSLVKGQHLFLQKLTSKLNQALGHEISFAPSLYSKLEQVQAQVQQALNANHKFSLPEIIQAQQVATYDYCVPENFNRSALFGIYTPAKQEQEASYTPGLLASNNTTIAIGANQLLQNPKLASELLQTLAQGNFTLQQAANSKTQDLAPEVTIACQANLVIMFNGENEEALLTLLATNIDKYLVQAVYKSSNNRFDLFTATRTPDREIFLQAYEQQVNSVVESAKAENEELELPEHIYKESAKPEKGYDRSKLFSHVNADQELWHEISYTQLNSLQKLNHNQSHLSSQEGAQDISQESSQESTQEAKINSISAKVVPAHIKIEKELTTKLEQALSQALPNSLYIVTKMLSLMSLLKEGENSIESATARSLIVQLLRYNETSNRIFWAVDKIAYYLRLSQGNYHKLQTILAQEANLRSTEYESLLNFVLDGYQTIYTNEMKVGMVNGLAFLDTNEIGKEDFGTAIRISCLAHNEAGQTLDVDSEIELAGGLARRANIISTTYIKSLFTDNIDFSASILTEQLYDPTDGDSASVASFMALASALSQLPVKQGIALTGSMDQFGNIQAVGGINQKIEAFYDICQARGLDRSQGVVIPAVNINNLCLRADIVTSIAQGDFHLFAADHVSQVFELLTDVPFATDKDDKTTLNDENDKYQSSYLDLTNAQTSLISAILQNLQADKSSRGSWLARLFA
ncbi:S16 family serine protease [Psittacicella hinzii]|uniref:endopeptidase La n=1 Tax=Psittacicella hinzii TaxID=2028575 RepID=A0A3A1YEP1_9GAMM|nr:S16 family serine protease [Psittacicella hinzii]RIY34684.1 hypothetical protein CKF58_07865 [Psittacicella hinzii]